MVEGRLTLIPVEPWLISLTIREEAIGTPYSDVHNEIELCNATQNQVEYNNIPRSENHTP